MIKSKTQKEIADMKAQQTLKAIKNILNSINGMEAGCCLGALTLIHEFYENKINEISESDLGSIIVKEFKNGEASKFFADFLKDIIDEVVIKQK